VATRPGRHLLPASYARPIGSTIVFVHTNRLEDTQ
jgi:hypothetical protein